jgi:nitrogen fixation NifU-like protein
LLDLQDLYQELILDHGRKPRNFGPLENATHEAEGYNPFCGDQVKVQMRVGGDMIESIQFSGQGCAISQASASLMTQAVKGKSVEDAENLFARFHAAAMGESDDLDLGGLECLCGVKNYPNRVKCATLAWHAMAEALKGGKKVTTE